MTPLLVAAENGDLTQVQNLLRENVTRITEADARGDTALLLSALNGHLGTVQWLLAEGGADITESNNDGEEVWTVLPIDDAESSALGSFLRFALLLDGPPTDFTARLPPEHQLLVAVGDRIRAALPQYLERRRALVEAHCPLLSPLLELVLLLSEPDTEDIWAMVLEQSGGKFKFI